MRTENVKVMVGEIRCAFGLSVIVGFWSDFDGSESHRVPYSPPEVVIFHFNVFNDPATLPSDWTLPKRQLKRLK